MAAKARVVPVLATALALTAMGCSGGEDAQPLGGGGAGGGASASAGVGGLAAEVEWVRVWGGGDDDAVSAVVAMPDGGVVAVGHAYGDVAGDLESAGEWRDALVTRFDADGNVAASWPARFGGGEGSRQANAVAVGDGDAVFVAGDFMGTIAIGAHVFTSGPADVDGFVARLEDGDVVWARHIEGPGLTVPTSVVFHDGAAIVAGHYDGFLTIDGEEHVAAGMDGFVMTFGAGGQVASFLRLGGEGHDVLLGVNVDAATSAAVAVGTTDGSITAAGTTVTSVGGDDVLLARLGTDLGVESLAVYGGAGRDVAWSVARSDGEAAGARLTVAGGHDDDLDFAGAELPVAAGEDGFAVGLDADDHALHGFGVRGNGTQVVRAARRVPGGGVVLAGSGTDDIDLDGAAEYASAGGRDVFVVLLGDDGELRAANAFGGAGDDRARGVAAVDQHRYYVGGRFDDALPLFGGIPAPGAVDDAWVAKIVAR
jgi:hypothetical protein